MFVFDGVAKSGQIWYYFPNMVTFVRQKIKSKKDTISCNCLQVQKGTKTPTGYKLRTLEANPFVVKHALE